MRKWLMGLVSIPALVAPVKAAGWVEVSILNNVLLEKFTSIQKAMGQAYSYISKDYLLGLKSRKQDVHFYFYEDKDYEIQLGFFYKPHRDQVKVAFGSIGKFVDQQTAMNLACQKIKEYLVSKGKTGYAMIDPSAVSLTAQNWYAKIPEGMGSAGVKISKKDIVYTFNPF